VTRGEISDSVDPATEKDGSPYSIPVRGAVLLAVSASTARRITSDLRHSVAHVDVRRILREGRGSASASCIMGAIFSWIRQQTGSRAVQFYHRRTKVSMWRRAQNTTTCFGGCAMVCAVFFSWRHWWRRRWRWCSLVAPHKAQTAKARTTIQRTATRWLTSNRRKPGVEFSCGQIFKGTRYTHNT